MLTVSPFDEADNARFQELVSKSIGKFEPPGPTSHFSELADFVWVLLDHMLHHWTMSDEKIMMERLSEFRSNLNNFEIEHQDDLDLLYQKLGHFGVE